MSIKIQFYRPKLDKATNAPIRDDEGKADYSSIGEEFEFTPGDKVVFHVSNHAERGAVNAFANAFVGLGGEYEVLVDDDRLGDLGAHQIVMERAHQFDDPIPKIDGPDYLLNDPARPPVSTVNKAPEGDIDIPAARTERNTDQGGFTPETDPFPAKGEAAEVETSDTEPSIAKRDEFKISGDSPNKGPFNDPKS